MESTPSSSTVSRTALLVLRVLTFVFLLIALILIATAKETSGDTEFKFKDFRAYSKCMNLSNSLSSLLSSLAPFFTLQEKWLLATKSSSGESPQSILLVYQDLLTGDELLSNSFAYKEIENGMLWEVEGKWVVKGAVDVDIGKGVEDVKVIDIVDTFRLQEQPPFDKKQFIGFIKRYIKLLKPKLDEEKQVLLKKHIEGATKYLLSKINDLQFFVGESMHDEGALVFSYYKDGANDPTFLYLAPSLKEVKVL